MTELNFKGFFERLAPMKHISAILLLFLTVGCANSPVRMNSMSDGELAASFSQEPAAELCRLYLRGLKYALDDPGSRLAGTSYRANALIEKEWAKRGLRKESCASPGAVAAVRAKVESDRAERAARAAAPPATISVPAQSPPIINRTTNCTSTRIGNTVHTNCY